MCALICWMGARVHHYDTILPSLTLTSRATTIMSALGDCVTEVALPPTLPLVDVHQRLHRHLPSSPYSHGAVYLPVTEDLEPLSPGESQGSTIAATSNAPPPPILVLRGDFKWRFGGEIEHNASPPWSWTAEQLCGAPHPYVARDLNCLTLTDRPKPPSCCPYTTINFGRTSASHFLSIAC